MKGTLGGGGVRGVLYLDGADGADWSCDMSCYWPKKGLAITLMYVLFVKSNTGGGGAWCEKLLSLLSDRWGSSCPSLV
jgi:hypothetical protein